MTVPLMIDTSSLPHLFFLAAFASAIAWIVLVAMGSTDTKAKFTTHGESEKVYDTDSLDQLHRTTTVCFQGAVVGVLFYFAFKHHHAGL